MSRPLGRQPHTAYVRPTQRIDRAVVETLTAVLRSSSRSRSCSRWPGASACRIRACSCSAGWRSGSCPGAADRARARARPVGLPATAAVRRAAETPIRDLRATLADRPALGGARAAHDGIVALVAHALVVGLGWAAAFAFGAIVGPTDALAATSVFRRSGRRGSSALIEGESLFNDATALVALRTAVIARRRRLRADRGARRVCGRGGRRDPHRPRRRLVSGELLRRIDDPPVEVLISLVVPFAAYLPADRLGVSGVLAAVTAGLIVGSRLGTILEPGSRVLWLGTWKMVNFILNGFVFVLIGLELPDDPRGVGDRPTSELLGLGRRHRRRRGRAPRLGLGLEPLPGSPRRRSRW